MSVFQSKKGLVSLFILVFIVMMGIGAWLGGRLNNLFFESVATKETKGKPINILFMGIDARDAKSNSRSDTMIVATIDPVSKKIAMVSIPRDTRIKNSNGKYDKINSINLLEGPEGACKKK
jgi:anionic cell wall polymer biosynthesis LytR-Cps2A-Psr (LCP) family protein